jgi:hypothetical protein
MTTYRRWHVPGHITLAWSNWIHCTLNNKRIDILEGKYAIKLVLDWSVMRIAIVVLVPVLLSLAIGIWLNSKVSTDLAIIQTARRTALYIVTAGACKYTRMKGTLYRSRELTLESACSKVRLLGYRW